MSLYEELNVEAFRNGKTTYESIIKELRDKARHGEFAKQFPEDDVLSSDMSRLKNNEGLKVQLYYGEDYNYWDVRWD